MAPACLDHPFTIMIILGLPLIFIFGCVLKSLWKGCIKHWSLSGSRWMLELSWYYKGCSKISSYKWPWSSILSATTGHLRIPLWKGSPQKGTFLFSSGLRNRLHRWTDIGLFVPVNWIHLSRLTFHLHCQCQCQVLIAVRIVKDYYTGSRGWSFVMGKIWSYGAWWKQWHRTGLGLREQRMLPTGTFLNF